MDHLNNGGPAFPVPYEYMGAGMTLRDYFAARMMIRELGEEIRPHQDYNYRNAAIRAYRMADAMLAERKEIALDAQDSAMRDEQTNALIESLKDEIESLRAEIRELWTRNDE